MNSLVTTLGFVSIFHILGGIAIGSVVRQVLRGQFACNSLFLLVWGVVFGGMPLVIGATVFTPHGNPMFLGIEIGVFVGTILIVALIPSWFIESFDTQILMLVAIGGLFVVIGVIAAFALITIEPLVALVFLVAFSGMGALAVVSGIKSAFKL